MGKRCKRTCKCGRHRKRRRKRRRRQIGRGIKLGSNYITYNGVDYAITKRDSRGRPTEAAVNDVFGDMGNRTPVKVTRTVYL